MVITIIGRRWFEKTNGNTYHSVNVYVDGEQVYRLPFDYGYGSMYRQNAMQWLAENGYFPGYERRNEWSLPYPTEPWFRENGIQIIDEVTDVQRKRDL